jgi:hypothetical protein
MAQGRSVFFGFVVPSNDPGLSAPYRAAERYQQPTRRTIRAPSAGRNSHGDRTRPVPYRSQSIPSHTLRPDGQSYPAPAGCRPVCRVSNGKNGNVIMAARLGGRWAAPPPFLWCLALPSALCPALAASYDYPPPSLSLSLTQFPPYNFSHTKPGTAQTAVQVSSLYQLPIYIIVNPPAPAPTPLVAHHPCLFFLLLSSILRVI